VRRAEHGGIFLRLLSLLVFAAFLALLYVVRHPLLRLALARPNTPTGPEAPMPDPAPLRFSIGLAFGPADHYLPLAKAADGAREYDPVMAERDKDDIVAYLAAQK